MQNRINTLFQQKQKNIFSVYFTAGYPELNDTEKIMVELEKNGVDLIEIGMPFSDPVADGPTIQKSSDMALQNGMTINLLFDQLKTIRERISIPLVLMGYLNPVMRYGVEAFCAKCNEVGIDGVILPDLPLEIYEEEYKAVFEANNVHNVFLITPQTTPARIQKIDALSNGFIYMVSSSSTTGVKESVTEDQNAYFNRMADLKLKTPRLIGFGISNHKTFANACQFANGAIIGSAFVKALGDDHSLERSIGAFSEMILKS